MKNDAGQRWSMGWAGAPSRGFPNELRLPPSARNLKADFSVKQAAGLRAAGVVHTEIENLLKLAVRVVVAYSSKTPKVTAVITPLKKLAQAAALTQRHLQALERAPAHDTALVEARQRLMQAAWRMGEDPLVPSPFPSIAAALERLRASAGQAIDNMPATQTRKTISTYPIQYIDDALWFGYKQVNGAPPENTRLEYRFRPSSDANSDFRKIVNICYEAAGVPVGAVGPLRAIRAYIIQRYPSKPHARMKKRQRRK